uniref:DUF1353 domain-containing protein n=1 Tax=viral metagenome TaxID=1070528 RepID=A0A6H1ZSQ1_9ZZZZ
MSSFTSPLIVTPLDDGRTWKLVEPFRYHIGDRNSENIITIPEGFVTDFASVPSIFWTLIPPYGKWGKAAVVHDFLYQFQYRTRKEADKIFLEAMGVLKVKNWRKYPMYLAVRWFGWLAWKNNS